LVKWVVDAGSLALPVGVALEDEFVGGGLEPVDRVFRVRVSETGAGVVMT
jgi:hypothetical protein